MKTENLSHIIYTSVSPKPLSNEDLMNILTIARSNNQKLNITGILLFYNENFFQILEGNKQTLDKLFNTIHSDSRHTSVTKIIEEPIHKRSFEDWSMGFKKITDADVKKIEGLNDFFDTNNSFKNITAGRAKKLLTAFAAGFWQNTF